MLLGHCCAGAHAALDCQGHVWRGGGRRGRTGAARSTQWEFGLDSLQQHHTCLCFMLITVGIFSTVQAECTCSGVQGSLARCNKSYRVHDISVSAEPFVCLLLYIHAALATWKGTALHVFILVRSHI